MGSFTVLQVGGSLELREHGRLNEPRRGTDDHQDGERFELRVSSRDATDVASHELGELVALATFGPVKTIVGNRVDLVDAEQTAH